MSFADALSNGSANTSQFSASHPHNLSAYSQEEKFTVRVDDLYVDLDIPSANARTITTEKSVIYPGGGCKESEGNDACLTDIVKSQEVLYPHEKYCERMTVEMERHEPICNLENHIIRQFETSNIPLVRNDPRILEGACKSKRKPGIMDIWGGHVSIVDRPWKNHDDVDPPINGGVGQSDEGSREGLEGKRKDGNEEKGINRFVYRNWKGVQYVAEFKEKHRKPHSGGFAQLAASTLNLKWPMISANGEAYLAGDMDDLLKETSFGSRTTFDEMFKPVNRICRAIVMERLAPLRYVKCVDHFKQAIREVVLAHHLMFFGELRALHCDISVDSLMVRYCDTSTLFGVLIDFDVVPMPGEPTGDHTGTRRRSRPFMAWELLESDPPRIHLERFDWESFFYIICWIGCRYSEGKEVNKSILSNWFNSDDATLVLVKQCWLIGPDAPQSFTPFCGTLLRDWIEPLQEMFYDGRKARRNAVLNEGFDEGTLGGHVTWERFWGILQR